MNVKSKLERIRRRRLVLSRIKRSVSMKWYLVDLSGKAINLDRSKSEVVLGIVVANGLAMMRQTQDDACQILDWAMELFEKKTLVVDESGKEKLLRLVGNLDMTALLKGQCERAIKSSIETKAPGDA